MASDDKGPFVDPLGDPIVSASRLEELSLDPATGEAPTLVPMADEPLATEQLDELDLDLDTAEVSRLAELDDHPMATEQLDELELELEFDDMPPLAELDDAPMATEQLDELELEPDDEHDEDVDDDLTAPAEGLRAAASGAQEEPPARPPAPRPSEQAPEQPPVRPSAQLEPPPHAASPPAAQPAPSPMEAGAPPVRARRTPTPPPAPRLSQYDELPTLPQPFAESYAEVEATELIGHSALSDDGTERVARSALSDDGTELVPRGLGEAISQDKVYGFDDDDDVGHTEVIDRDDLLAPGGGGFTPRVVAALPTPIQPAAPAPDIETPWRSLHPASLVVNLIPRTWRTLSSMWPLFLAVLVGGQSMGMELGDGLFLLFFLFSGFANTVVHFLTLRYRVDQGKLEIRQGLLNRQARVIDPQRIQNVSLVRNPFHKLSGLVEVRLETAGDVRTEGLLSALSVDHAQELMQALDQARGHLSDGEAATPRRDEELLRLSLGEIIGYGLSSGSAGKVTLLFAIGLEAFSVIEPGQAERALVNLPGQKMAALVLLAFAVSWTAETALAVIRHYGFTLSHSEGPGPKGRVEHKLHATHGLFTRREVEVPLRKVQLAMADEPLLRRSMGYGTVMVETAGLGSFAEGVTQAELVVPMVDRDQLGATLGQAIPQAQVDPWTAELLPAHRSALWRGIIAGSIRSSLIAVALVVFAWPWGLLGLTLPLSAVVTAWLDWRFQGWLITPEVVVTRRGFWRRRTWVLARDKLQSVHLVQGPLMRGYGLGRLAVRVAGSQVILPDIAYAQAESLVDELRPISR